MVGLTFSPGTLETALQIAQEPESVVQASGLAGVGPSSADIALMPQQAMQGLQQTAAQSLATMRQPPSPQSIIAFSRSANKFYAGGMTFSPDDVPSALQASQRLAQPTPPAPGNVAGDWEFVSPQEFGQYMQGLRAPRGFGENLALGARGAAEATVGGLGRLAEVTNIAPETGRAIAGFAERTFGQTPNEQARSALIQQSNSLWSNIVDAAVQGAPSLIPTILAGLGGAAIGGPAGAAIGLTATAGRTVGSLAGAAATIYPMELKGFYDAAQKNGYNVNDPRVQNEMLAAAAGTTLLQSIAPAAVARGFSQFFREAAETAGQEVARSALRNAATGAAKTSLQEGFAEAMSSLAQQAVFDPEFRRKLNANDIKALLPYATEKYAEEALISFGAGAILGGAFGGAANFRATTAKPINLNDVAGEQAAAQAQPAGLLPPPDQAAALPGTAPTALQLTYQPMARDIEERFAPGYTPGATGGEAVVTPPPVQPLALPAPPTYVSPTGEVGASVAPYVAPTPQAAPSGVQEAYAPGYTPGGMSQAPAPYPTLAPAPLPTAPATIPAATPAQRAAGFEAAGRTAPQEGPMAPALRRLLRGQAATEAEAQRALQEQQAVAARTAAVEPDMRAQAALEERTILDTEGASDGKNKLKDDGRRRTIAGFNTLTAEQQDRVLAQFDNDVQQFFDYVRKTPPDVVRTNLARVAGVEPAVFNVKTPTAAAPQPAAQPVQLKRGESSATQAGQQPESRLRKRADVGEGRPPAEAGGRNRLKQGGQEQAAEAAPEVAAPPPTPKKPVRRPKPEGRKEGAVKRPPEGEAAPSAKPAAAAETEVAEATSTDKSNREQLRAANEELGAVDERIKAIGKEYARATDRAALAKLAAERTVLEERRDALREQRRGLEALLNGPKVETPFGPGATVAAAKGKGETGRFSLKGYNVVTGAMGADNRPLPPFPAGRVALGVRRFLSGLAVKPKTNIFKNQADLKARNPALYQQAKASLAPGVDFDKAPAAGFSFGDGNVIIFSDNIASDQHLNFVMAHETLGHFGMRGIMPGDKFNALMERLYDENIRIRAGVDNAMEARGLRKAEAVEEYLSDYAGLLETSIIKRVWDGIKGFLNRLGVRFGDEAMRYFLDQAKRYVRQGQQGVTFDAQAVADRLMFVETGANDTGRFSLSTVADDNVRFMQIMHSIGLDKGYNFTEGLKALKSFGINRADQWDKFKAKFLSLGNFRALNNPGAYEVNQLHDRLAHRVSYIVNKYNEQLASLTSAPKEHQDKVSYLLYGGRVLADAKYEQSPVQIKERLLSLDAEGNPKANRSRIKALVRQYALSFDDAKRATNVTLTVTDSAGRTQQRKVEFDGVKDLTKEQYADYLRALDALADVEADLLEAKYIALLGTDKNARDAIKRMMKSGDLTSADTAFIDETLKVARRIYTQGTVVDASGIAQPAPDARVRMEDFVDKVNAAILGERTDRNATVAAYFDKNVEAADAYITKLMDFKSRRSTDLKEPTLPGEADRRFTFQNALKPLILETTNLDVAEQALKKQIATGNISTIRRGGYEVRVQAVVDGKPTELAQEYQERLVYSQFDAPSKAMDAADAFNTTFKGKRYDVLAIVDGVPVSRSVELRAVAGDAVETQASDPALDFDTFLYGLRLVGINPTPEVMGRIITRMTAAGDSARSRMLKFSATPGYDPTRAVQALSERIASRASTIGKTEVRPEYRRLMDRDNDEVADLWAGGPKRVIALKKQVDAAEGAAKKYAQRDLDRALRMFRETNPGVMGKDGKEWDGSEKTEPEVGARGLRRGNEFFNEAVRSISVLEDTKNVVESNLEGTKAVSYVKAMTSVLLLSMSPAQFVMNMASAYSNWAPFMATYSERNGFGGGFGTGKALAEYHKALRQIGLRGVYVDTKFNTAAFYDEVSRSQKLQADLGLNAREAEFIAQEIREGKMIPAQSNALLSTALGHLTSPGMRKFVDAIMTPFNYSEQAVRRAAGLAAYRMQYDFAIAAGKSEADARADARAFALESLDVAFGNYNVMNRPPAWRQGLPSLLYMYKVYPTTVIQLMRNLPRAGQIGMLGVLWALSGAAGFPFADDAEDILDTLLQKFGPRLGIEWRGSRIELIDAFESVLPGVSPWVIKGALATLLASPADTSRFGMADLIPGTGILLAGAKPAEEFKDIAGPAASVLLQLANTAADLIQVPFSEKKTLEDVARSSPATFLRMLGDAAAYLQTGAIVDKRGYVVSQDMTAATIITRLLGFYPSAAADQYEVIKYANRMVNYQKEMTVGFRQAWIKAKLRGDEAGAQAIEQGVADWNDATRGTGLEIRKFVSGSNKGLREASRPAGERALRAAPTAARQDIQGLMESILD